MTMIKCKGFRAAGVVSGLKKNRGKDLGIIISDVPANVAGVFTRNRVKAAPVLLDRERVKSGVSRAIIVNSGNAKCCTGKKGLQDAERMTASVAASLQIDNDHVLAASTGVIGEPMPVEKIEAAVHGLVDSADQDGFGDFAEAIMTTDTVPKIVMEEGRLGEKGFTIIGMAKGAGMIRPDMATMLCFVCTDIGAPPDILKTALLAGTKRSMNRISIDGDTSTNDTVLIMANGLASAVVRSDDDRKIFQESLDAVLIRLARMLVKDGEGATKLVEIVVKGALSDDDADRIADTIAHSNLVKTALFGEDANWGRIIAAAGRAGVEIDPEKIDIRFNQVLMVENGIGCGRDAEAKATEVLKQAEFTILMDCHMGVGTASVVTCDFSIGYVKINADYRS